MRGGLYPLKSFPNKQAHGVTKLPSSRWHSHLGHPSATIVHQVLNKNKLTFVPESNKESVCDACQKGKSHQLPYPKSTSVSRAPLELVFSDVWGPTPTYVGKNNFMLVSLTIIASSHGFICGVINLKFFSDFMTSKSLLSV